MIRRLRRVHRVVFVFLALALPVLMTRALTSQPTEPRSSPVAPGAMVIDGAMLTATWSTELGPIRYRIQPPAAAGAQTILDFAPGAELRAPDLLLYWTRRAPPVSGIERGDSLLGRVAGLAPVAVRLPMTAADVPGTLVLYSLGHRSVVGTLPLDAARGARP